MWNEAYNDFLRYRKLYETCKTGAFNLAGGVTRLKEIVAEIDADPNRKALFIEALLAFGADWETLEEKVEPLESILAEILNQYPGAL